MQVTKQEVSKTKYKLLISAASKDLEPIRLHVLTHFTDKVKVPGFRAGHAPAAMVEKNIDQKAFADEFMEHAINDLYGLALKEVKMRPAGSPKVEIKKFVPYTVMEFEVEIEVIGIGKLPNYKTVKMAKKTVNVTPKDIDDVIKSLQARTAERQESSKPARNGDELLIDFDGTDAKGKEVKGASGKDYPLILGSKSFIPGFEEKLVGLKKGADTKFVITFPKDYGVAALQSKKVTFKVNVKKVSHVVEMTANDAFAGKVGPFKTLVELKTDIKKQLALEKQQQAERNYQNELVRKLVEKSTFDIPDSLVEEQISQIEEEEKRNLTYRGQTWQEHLDAEGITAEAHRERQRPEAEARVKGGLLLSEVAEAEKLSVTPEEVEIRIQLLKGQYKDAAMQAELDNPENQRDIEARLLTEKTIQKLVDYASK